MIRTAAMDLFHRQSFNRAYQVLDVSLLALSFALAFLLVDFPGRVHSLTQILSMRVSVLNFLLFLLMLLAMHLCFDLAGLYHMRRTVPLRRELTDSALGVTAASVLMWIWGLTFRVQLVHAEMVLWFWIWGTLLIAGNRILLQFLLRRLRSRGRNLRQVLIVGTNARAQRCAKYLQQHPQLGYRVVGYADDPWKHAPTPALSQPVVTTLEGFPSYLRDNAVDEVILCLPMKSLFQEHQKIVEMCQKLGVTVRFPPDQLQPANATREDRAPTLVGDAQYKWRLLKRLLDLTIAGLLLVLLLPILLGIALAIRATSPGDALFVQERIGLHRRRFRMLKFRTMRSDAEQMLSELARQNEVQGPAFKMKNDPRITPIGRFLRRTSLDELPQLLNVLRGEMSLVGPRPLPVRDYAGFTEDWHRRRFSVLPGLTGLWQVSGRSSVVFERWMELDMRYIDNWSLWLDIKILLLSFPAVLRRKGAY